MDQVQGGGYGCSGDPMNVSQKGDKNPFSRHYRILEGWRNEAQRGVEKDSVI